MVDRVDVEWNMVIRMHVMEYIRILSNSDSYEKCLVSTRR
jgi:hypothetical protein